MKRNAFFIFWIFIWAQVLFAARVDTVSVFSPSMHKQIMAVVVLPAAYKTSQDSFPVVYLLHGYSGKYSDWPNKIDLKPLAERYGFILICPDGGYNSWYLDSPIDSGSQYETHIIKELIPFIKNHYRTAVSQCAITGLSMGGQGALYLALRHPGLFSAAGSLSGGVDLTYSTKRWEIADKIGSYEKYSQRWRDLSVISMISLFRKAELPLFIDCGVKDIFIGINRRLHKKLLDAGVDHEYIERPGGHSWSYWTNALEYHLLFFKKQFIRQAAK